MKKRNKKYSPEKSISRFLIGSIYEFDVKDPLGEEPLITNTSFNHKNPINKLKMKGKLKQIHQILQTKKLKWRSRIEVQFYDGKEAYSRPAEMIWIGSFNGVEDEYQQAIEDIFNVSNMKHYLITQVKAEVIGFPNQIDSDNDFTITKTEAA